MSITPTTRPSSPKRNAPFIRLSAWAFVRESGSNMSVQRASVARAIVETLEERQMFSWGAFPTLVGQDVAAAKYPSVNGQGVTIVDIDTGVNMNHPALQGRVWTNPGEIAGNGRDDDGDGLVDDVHGWNYVNNNNNVTDDQGHGTMTAGIMVANHFVNTGNSRGYSGDGKEYQGVASGAQVIPLKIIDASLQMDVTRVDKALQWVIANYKRFNIVAVNMSLDVGYSGYQLIQNDIKTLWGDGVFVAAASGNGSNTNNAMAYPAAGGYTMPVGALNADDTVSTITSRGPSLGILAPGNGVVYLSQGTDYWQLGPATSAATPWITAAGALLKQVNPSLTPAQIAQTLRDTGKSVYEPATGLTFKRLQLDAAIAAAGGSSSTNTTPSSTPVTTPAPTPTPVGSSSPFGGTPISVPGLIEAENFDRGGEGVAYHDMTASNDGGSYRNEGVDIDNGIDSERGYAIGHIRAGEWTKYTVNVAQSGTYSLDLRVASQGPGGAFHVEVDGQDETGEFNLPQTGSDNSWTTITKGSISLSSGTHTIRLVCDANGAYGPAGDINWMKLSGGSTVQSVPSQPSPPSTPSPTPIPASQVVIQGESATSLGGITRTSKDLSNVDSGDWALFAGVNFGSGLSTFTVNLAVADAYAGKQIQIRVGSPTGQIIGTLTTRGTGSWGNYQAQSTSIQTTTGVQDIYLTFSGGYGVGNIDSIQFS